MKRVKHKITAILNAITFAEAGEHETAQKFLDQSPEPSPLPDATRSAQPGFGTPDIEPESFGHKLEHRLAAATFAEAADFRTARDLVGSGDRPRTVLLVIEGDAPDHTAFSYALALCKRMGLKMDILQTIPMSESKPEPAPSMPHGAAVPRELSRLLRQLEEEGVPFGVTVIRGDVNEKLCDYTTLHKDVIMIVYDSPKVREEPSKSRGWERIFDAISRKLAVPLVRVVEKQPVRQLS
jgi:hypothetical protein